MRIKRISMKNMIIFLLVCIIFFISKTDGIYAWFVSSDEQHNYFTVGHNDVTIDEEFPDPEIIPGKEVKKIVKFTNTGTVSCFVRAKYLLSDCSVKDQIELKFGSLKWQQEEDGYYYYEDSVPSGKTTEPFLTAVSFKEDMEIQDFDLSVYTETVQSDNHLSAREAFAHLKAGEGGENEV
jgi:hypothetical protein